MQILNVYIFKEDSSDFSGLFTMTDIVHFVVLIRISFLLVSGQPPAFLNIEESNGFFVIFFVKFYMFLILFICQVSGGL